MTSDSAPNDTDNPNEGPSPKAQSQRRSGGLNFLPEQSDARRGWRGSMIAVGPRATMWSAYGLAILLLIVGGALMVALGSEETRSQGVFVLMLSAAVLIALIVIGWMFFRHGRELARFRRAQLALRRDNAEAAIEELNTLLASGLAPQRRPLAHFMLGKAFDRLGRTDEAIAAYREASTFWPALNNLGSLLLGKGDYRRAEAAFKAAIGLRPGEPVLYNHLALVYQRMDEPVLARETLEACLKATPRSAATRRNLERLGEKKPIEVSDVPFRTLHFSPLE